MTITYASILMFQNIAQKDLLDILEIDQILM